MGQTVSSEVRHAGTAYEYSPIVDPKAQNTPAQAGKEFEYSPALQQQPYVPTSNYNMAANLAAANAKAKADAERQRQAAEAERQRQAAAAAAAAAERQRQAVAASAAAAATAAATERQRQAAAAERQRQEAAAAAAEAERQRQAAAAAAAAEAERQRQAAAAAAAASEAEAARQRAICQKEGGVYRDSSTGQVHFVEQGALRVFPSAEVYRSWGSPSFENQASKDLGTCTRGRPMELRATAPAPTTPATPAPVPLVPLPPVPALPSHLKYPPNIVTLVHRDSWMTQRQLKVLTVRGGEVILAPLEPRDLSQAFALGPDGSVRVLAGSGMYLATARDDGGDRPCSTVTSRASLTAEGVWSLQSETFMHPLQYRLVAETCKRPLGTNTPGFLTVNADGDASTSWFIVPVARLG